VIENRQLRANDHSGRIRVGTLGYVVIGPWRHHFATGSVRFDPDGCVTVPQTAALEEFSRMSGRPVSVVRMGERAAAPRARGIRRC
jgi:hypothetical protein